MLNPISSGSLSEPDFGSVSVPLPPPQQRPHDHVCCRRRIPPQQQSAPPPHPSPFHLGIFAAAPLPPPHSSHIIHSSTVFLTIQINRRKRPFTMQAPDSSFGFTGASFGASSRANYAPVPRKSTTDTWDEVGIFFSLHIPSALTLHCRAFGGWKRTSLPMLRRS